MHSYEQHDGWKYDIQYIHNFLSKKKKRGREKKYCEKSSWRERGTALMSFLPFVPYNTPAATASPILGHNVFLDGKFLDF